MTVTVKTAMAAAALLSQPSPAAAAPSRALGLAALVTWLLDAGSGAYMLATWIVRGGLRRQRTADDRLAPAVVFGHFGLATTGLLVWVSYLASGWAFLGWLAIGVLTLVIGLGISTVTLWTPFPAHGPGVGGEAEPVTEPSTLRVTDDDLARALTDAALLARLVDDVVTRAPHEPAQGGRPRGLAGALIPAGHGMAALATVLLAVLAVVSATR
jgi:manganese efflux pump family protein